MNGQPTKNDRLRQPGLADTRSPLHEHRPTPRSSCRRGGSAPGVEAVSPPNAHAPWCPRPSPPPADMRGTGWSSSGPAAVTASCSTATASRSSATSACTQPRGTQPPAPRQGCSTAVSRRPASPSPPDAQGAPRPRRAARGPVPAERNHAAYRTLRAARRRTDGGASTGRCPAGSARAGGSVANTWPTMWRTHRIRASAVSG